MRIETFSSVFPFDIKWQLLSYPENNLVLISTVRFSFTYFYFYEEIRKIAFTRLIIY